ncbi:MAG: hypothetical protein CL927_16015 [Deltaproteobacteria bacterium]|nr:hypothetical protein [Deltaproteobacteria bacterium]HCH64296.1 hypothetical protein [Deltaproteobacteria bacterium]
MRDAYILGLHATTRAADRPAERLGQAVEAFKGLHGSTFGEKPPVTWMAVSTSDGPVARSLGLLAGYSARLCARDVGAGSGLASLACAARAVTSGFESVAAAVSFGASVDDPEWSEALQERFTRVSPERAQSHALTRAGVDVQDVIDRTDMLRAARLEAGDALVSLGTQGELPHAPDFPGLGVVLLAGHQEIREHNWRTRARITSVVEVGLDPALGPSAAVEAAQAALHRLHLRPSELDFIQVDARLASAPSVVARALDFQPEAVNPLGDALTLGGGGAAEGILGLDRLLRALEEADRRFGLVVGLEPMGGATAVVVDRQFYI